MDDTQGRRHAAEQRRRPRRAAVAGPGSRLDRRHYAAPPPPRERALDPAARLGTRHLLRALALLRQRHRRLRRRGGSTRRRFGFRKDPYASRHSPARGLGVRREHLPRRLPRGVPRENRSWYLGLVRATPPASRPRASSASATRRATAETRKSDFFKAKQNQFAFTPLLALPLVEPLHVLRGPDRQVRVRHQDQDDATLLNHEQPYGYGDFGEVGATRPAGAGHARRGESAGRRRPAQLRLPAPRRPRRRSAARCCPTAWDVEETFGSVKGNAAVYLSPRSEKAPTLALRAGGAEGLRRLSLLRGRLPRRRARRLRPSAGDEPGARACRGTATPATRACTAAPTCASTSRASGSSCPGTWGLLGLRRRRPRLPRGRGLERWHNGYGGGLWFAWLDRANAVSASFARSDGENAIYVQAGFAF